MSTELRPKTGTLKLRLHAGEAFSVGRNVRVELSKLGSTTAVIYVTADTNIPVFRERLEPDPEQLPDLVPVEHYHALRRTAEEAMYLLREMAGRGRFRRAQELSRDLQNALEQSSP